MALSAFRSNGALHHLTPVILIIAAGGSGKQWGEGTRHATTCGPNCGSQHRKAFFNASTATEMKATKLLGAAVRVSMAQG